MSKSLTKEKLIAAVAQQSGHTKSDVYLLFNALETIAKAALQGGSTVTIPGLVKLTPKLRLARVGRNPANGEAVNIPEKTVVNAKAVPSVLS